MTRAVRSDAARYQRAYHSTTSRLERFKAVHDLCVKAVRKALFDDDQRARALYLGSTGGRG